MKVKIDKQLIVYWLLSFVLALFFYFVCAVNLFLGLFCLLVVGKYFFKLPKLLSVFFLQLIFFQNAFIAWVSPVFKNTADFKMLHGLNFVIPFILTLVFLVYQFNKTKRMFLMATMGVVLLLFLYFTVGLGHYGFMNSLVYLRLFLNPIIYLFTGLLLSKLVGPAFIIQQLKVLFLICLIVTTLQFLFPLPLSILLNDLSYYNLKVGIGSWDELLEFYARKRFFNISWFDVKMYRIGSMIKSFISLGYFLIILGLYFYWPRNKWKMLFVILIVTVAVNSKGAILVSLFTIFLYFLIYRSNLSTPLAYVSYFTVNLGLIVLGFLMRNEHIVGFVAGMGHLDSLGNGFGFAGNLASTRLSAINGPPLKDLGYWTRFQNGSESVYGVLFSSMGALCVFYLMYLLRILRLNFKTIINSKHQKILGILSIVLFLQGVFQEEAYAPYAFGLVMFLIGVNHVGSYERKTI